MRYTLLFYSNEADFAEYTPADWGELKAAYGKYIADLNQAGVFVDTDWLQPTQTATTLSLRGGTKRVQDGPFADTKESLGGYMVIRVPDLDAALAWAEKCPAAKTGTVEIRPSALGES